MPHSLGFNHITSEEVIQNHTRQLARNLMTKDVTSNPAILVLIEYMCTYRKVQIFLLLIDHIASTNIGLL